MLISHPAVRAGLLLLALSTAPGFSQQDTLPNVPHPSDPANNTPAAIQKRKWSDVIEPGETVPRLSAGDKLMVPIHEELRLRGWFPTFASSGLSHFHDGNPKYGSDSGAFGQRLGAAAIRDLSMRTFSDGVLPAILHEDPRYFRKGNGSFMNRTLYAFSRTFVDQRDSGKSGFNTSVVAGHGMASALTMTYYPDRSATGRVVFETWGTSLLGDAGGHWWAEFWPSIRNKISRHNHADQP